MADDDEDEPMWDLAEKVHRAHCLSLNIPGRVPVMFGRFQGIVSIGHGSYGFIFRVRDPTLDREVALKLCKVAGEKHRELLLKEARIIAKLSHPNIITIHDVGSYESDDQYNGTPFIVMELARGGTARDLIKKQPRWEDCVEFYLGAARGLAAAHAEGIVHGDFKPSNVMVSSGGARVADFGFACTLGSADEHQGGTRGYMAPEQIMGGGNSELADQWALCASLWELLEGVRPFYGENPLEMLGVIDAVAVQVRRGESNPPRLRGALLRGLSFDGEDRWPSMEVLIEELEAILVEEMVAEAIRAQPSEPSEPNEPSPHVRQRLAGGILVYMVLGGLIGSVIVTLLTRSPQEQLAQESRDRAPEALNRVEPEVSENAETTKAEGCLVSAEIFHVPSPELEEVCELIRLGKVKQADIKWRAVRAERMPEDTDESHDTDLMAIAVETKIVADTCNDYALSIEDEALIERLRDLSSRMSANYKYDKESASPR